MSADPVPMVTTEGKCAGMTLVELVMTLAVAAILLGGGAVSISKFGTRGKVDAEAQRVVDQLLKLRSMAATGMRNPCMDFPAADSVRIYGDTSATPNGFGAGDRLLGGFRYRGKVRALSITGGRNRNHEVCFQSNGVMGSATTALVVTLGLPSGDPVRKRVRLLPSTGMAKVL